MVDYSKWDRMDFSDSDDDNDTNQLSPRVTSLDSPGRVTIGTDGSLEIGKSSLPPQPSKKSAAVDIASEKVKAEEARKERKLRQWKDQLTRNGGEHYTTVQYKQNTDIKLPIYWSQDRYSVTLRLGFPHLLFPSKSIRVQVLGALNYKDRFSAVGSGSMSGYRDVDQDGSTAYGAVEIISVDSDKTKTLLLSDKIPRPVYMNQNEDEIGFDIEDNLGVETNPSSGDTKCTKLISITFPKAVPMEGMVIWWENALLGLPKIDTTNISERTNPVDKVMTVEEYNNSMDKKQTASPGDAKKEAFAKAWNEAHLMFREKVKAKEKQEVHVDD